MNDAKRCKSLNRNAAGVKR
jgi:hypothetical protein